METKAKTTVGLNNEKKIIKNNRINWEYAKYRWIIAKDIELFFSND